MSEDAKQDRRAEERVIAAKTSELADQAVKALGGRISRGKGRRAAVALVEHSAEGVTRIRLRQECGIEGEDADKLLALIGVKPEPPEKPEKPKAGGKKPEKPADPPKEPGKPAE